MPNQKIILHNYPQSPVAEKVRVALGIKSLDWHNVEIPRIPPKPMLTALTGGYRRTPVMQIGADIFCDSQCIIRELERRYPEPSFMPTSDAGLMWALSRWTDGALFDLAVKIVLGSAGDALPKDFAEDRGRLYLGEDWAEGLRNANAQLPHLVAQMRTTFHWLNSQLSDGRTYLLGANPAVIDAQFYHVVWFINGRWEGGKTLLAEFPALLRWTEIIHAIGHGQQKEMTPKDALEYAKQSEPTMPNGVAKNDPQGLKMGQLVKVSPDVNGGEQPVEGRVHFADTETITLLRKDDSLGEISVSFPRSGYYVETGNVGV